MLIAGGPCSQEKTLTAAACATIFCFYISDKLMGNKDFLELRRNFGDHLLSFFHPSHIIRISHYMLIIQIL